MREYDTEQMRYLSFDTEYEMKEKLKELTKQYGKNKKIVSGPIKTISGDRFFISIPK